jgi:asparagine synthase (glutamine-hydrolysing)
MVATMDHRGPDSNGVYLGGHGAQVLAVGHNRLSIIDLTDCAAQPMRSADGRYVLIYNGEVYNYKEIAQQLEPGDLEEHSTGDTAVVLASLLRWGPAAFEKFNGMWSLVLHDTWEGTLLISRDRFGKKPLYYFQDGDAFYLASEVKAILAAAGRRFAINPRVAIPFLTRGLLDTSNETFFEGILQFPAASWQRLQLDSSPRIGEDTIRFWRHPVELAHPPEPGAVSPAAIRELFVDSVRLRLRSDVPLGVLLSGGIDSSAIVGAIGAMGMLDNVTVLSVVSDDPASTEEPFIDIMSRHAGVATHKLNVSDDPQALLDRVPDCCWHNDQPLAAVSWLAHMGLMGRAADLGIKVLLTGQGADEQLGGYNKFLWFHLQELARAGRFGAVARTLTQFSRNSNTLREFSVSEAMRYVGSRRLSTDTFIAAAHRDTDTVQLGLQGSYAHREWIDLTRTSIPVLLHVEDRLSMSRSIEMRVPFLDYRLVELLARVPASEKFEGGWTKSIFRKAIAGLVPDEIRYRKDKKGFNVPVEQWMRGAFSEPVDALFRSDLLMERLGFVDADRLRSAYGRYRAGGGYLNGRHFFRAYTFELFLRRFADFIEV